MSFGRTFVLLAVLVVGTGSPAFAVKTGGGECSVCPGRSSTAPWVDLLCARAVGEPSLRKAQ